MGGGKSESYLLMIFGSKFRICFGFVLEHTGGSAQQRAGTLERAPKYDQEASTKPGTIQHQASEMARTTSSFFTFPPPRNGGEMPPFSGRLFFFRLFVLAG